MKSKVASWLEEASMDIHMARANFRKERYRACVISCREAIEKALRDWITKRISNPAVLDMLGEFIKECAACFVNLPYPEVSSRSKNIRYDRKMALIRFV
ncbi:MAG: HEPN domain-containing protein [Planctomycetota bacterium]|jgi:HEPN domain-containing protein